MTVTDDDISFLFDIKLSISLLDGGAYFLSIETALAWALLNVLVL